MRHKLPPILLVCLLVTGCGSLLTRMTASVSAIEEARIPDDLEPSEEYYMGRGASAVIVDAHPMPDLKDAPVAERIEYLTTMSRYIERTSANVTRNTVKLGGFVERSFDQQEHIYNLALYKGVQVGVLESAEPMVFSTAGGFIWIAEGALSHCKSEDEVAALVAVEIGHVVLDHAMETYRRRHLNRIVGETWFEGDGVAANFGRLVVSYSDEVMNSYYEHPYNLEAGNWAVMAMLAAGYEPRALVSVLQSMEAARGDPATAGDWLMRQDDLDSRISTVAEFIDAKEMKVADTYADKAKARQARFEKALGR